MEQGLINILEKLGNNCYNEGAGTLKTTIADEIIKAIATIKQEVMELIPKQKYLIDSISNTCKHYEGSIMNGYCGLSNNLSDKCTKSSCGQFDVNLDEAIIAKGNVDGFNESISQIQQALEKYFEK
jgi:hypothetical protein